MIDGAAARFLAARREDLNRRYAAARRRWPALDGERFGAVIADVLPRLDADERLLSAAYDLALLHVGRDSFASCPGLHALMTETLPRLAPLLARAPETVAALSNAVERMAGRSANGEDASVLLARVFGELGPHADAPDALLAAGALAAWRLGEARLRASALESARELPPRSVLIALGLRGWPDAAASLALAALAADAWRRPEATLGPELLERIARSPESAATLSVRLAAWRPFREWSVAARVGDFTGFGGSFDAPPMLVDAAAPDRHTFFVTIGDEPWRVTADVYGAVCRRDAEPPQGSVRSVSGAAGLKRVLASLVASGPVLLPDGTLTANGETSRIAALARASSLALRETVLAASFVDSHRLAVLVPPAEVA